MAWQNIPYFIVSCLQFGIGVFCTYDQVLDKVEKLFHGVLPLPYDCTIALSKQDIYDLVVRSGFIRVSVTSKNSTQKVSSTSIILVDVVECPPFTEVGRLKLLMHENCNVLNIIINPAFQIYS